METGFCSYLITDTGDFDIEVKESRKKERKNEKKVSEDLNDAMATGNNK